MDKVGTNMSIFFNLNYVPTISTFTFQVNKITTLNRHDLSAVFGSAWEVGHIKQAQIM